MPIRFLTYKLPIALARVSASERAQGKLEERVARWLLMAHDRLQSDVIPVTHKMFSQLLGVRRAGITVALQGLEKRGLIERSRGSITVVDRARLIASANGLYGQPRIEFERLFGRIGSDDDLGPLTPRSKKTRIITNGSARPS